jgi:hypothetical protein
MRRSNLNAKEPDDYVCARLCAALPSTEEVECFIAELRSLRSRPKPKESPEWFVTVALNRRRGYSREAIAEARERWSRARPPKRADKAFAQELVDEVKQKARSL